MKFYGTQHKGAEFAYSMFTPISFDYAYQNTKEQAEWDGDSYAK